MMADVYNINLWIYLFRELIYLYCSLSFSSLLSYRLHFKNSSSRHELFFDCSHHSLILTTKSVLSNSSHRTNWCRQGTSKARWFCSKLLRLMDEILRYFNGWHSESKVILSWSTSTFEQAVCPTIGQELNSPKLKNECPSNDWDMLPAKGMPLFLLNQVWNKKNYFAYFRIHRHGTHFANDSIEKHGGESRHQTKAVYLWGCTRNDHRGYPHIMYECQPTLLWMHLTQAVHTRHADI